MPFPRFSVVIPTREGAHTLKYTLQTCLGQDFDDYEVVVCDNHSSPATRELVEGLASPRIKYVRSEKPLSMSSNWELAVAHAAGEFVTVLGDDDGLLPHALALLDRLLRELKVPAIRWAAAFYLWPSIALPGEANYLRIPLDRRLRFLDGRAVMASVIAFEPCYTTLPMLYNSVVQRSLLDALRRKVGRLFRNRYPDVCSGFLLAHEAGRYASLGLPMTVAGLSDKSVGVGHHFMPEKSSIGAEFLKLNAEEGVRTQKGIPDLHVFPVVPVADCFQVAKEALFPEEALTLDRKTLTTHCVWCLRTDSLDQWQRCLATLRASLADDPELVNWFDATFAEFPPSVSGPLRLRSDLMGSDGENLHLGTDAFGVADVAGAAELCGKILCHDRVAVSALLRSAEELSEAERLRLELNEKEAAIQKLEEVAEAYRQTLASRTQQLQQVAEAYRQTLEERNQQLQEVDRQLQRLRRLTRYPRAIVRVFRAVVRTLSRGGKRAA